MALENQPGDPLEISAREWNQVRAATLGLDGIRDGGGRFIPEVLIAKTDAFGISARAGNTVGSAEVTVYSVDSNNVLASTSRTEICKNISGTPIEADTYIVIAREWGSRVFVVVVESCEPPAS